MVAGGRTQHISGVARGAGVAACCCMRTEQRMKTWREMAVGAGLKVINAEFFPGPAKTGMLETDAPAEEALVLRVRESCFSLGFPCVIAEGGKVVAAAVLDGRDESAIVTKILGGVDVMDAVKLMCETAEGVWVAIVAGFGVGGVEGLEQRVVRCRGDQVTEDELLDLEPLEASRVRAAVAAIGAEFEGDWSLRGCVAAGAYVVTGVVIE